MRRGRRPLDRLNIPARNGDKESMRAWSRRVGVSVRTLRRLKAEFCRTTGSELSGQAMSHDHPSPQTRQGGVQP